MKENKKSQKQRDLLIAQSNDLVRAKYSTSLWERRLFIEMIQSIKQADTEFQWVTLHYDDLVKTYEITSRNDYKRITKAAKELGKKVMFLPFIENGEEREISESVVQVNVPKHLDDGFRKYVKLKFNDALKPLLLKLKKDYFLYDKANIIGLKGKYTFDFYELFKHLEREKKGVIKIYFPINKFREHFLVDKYGNLTNKYPKFSDIEKYVIQPSQKEMRELTDLSFSYKKVKEGRTVAGIEFEGYKNRKKKAQKKTSTKPKEEKSFEIYNEPSETLKALIKVGIAPKKAQSLINTYGENVVAQELKHAQKELKSVTNVKSTTGFIISKIEQQSYTKKQAILQAERAQKQQKQKAKKEQQQLHKLKIEELRAEYQSELGNAVGEMTKDLDKKQINMAILEYGGNNIFIKRAIERAEEQGNKKEAKELRESVLAKGLKDEKLQSFDKYLEMVHQYKLGRDEEGEQVLQSSQPTM